jgi:dTDP-4-amino-4,6-dideoxygalactose transaminase
MFPGNQYRMGELAAAVALAQFDRLDGMLGRCRATWERVRSQVRAALPDFAFRATGDDAGDAGITLFLDLQTPAAAGRFAQALAAEGIAIGPSSGMVNLLHEEYILQKAQPHPLLPPFGPGWAGEHVVYNQADAPRTDEILGSMVAIGIGPRFTDADADDIATAIIKVGRRMHA